ncbi:PucR family transcriptional regulator [Nocardia gipuzkoensis]
MPLTLRKLIANRELELSVVTGSENLDRPIVWVHSTDLLDPTPFMQGGELLLATGLALQPDHAECAAYIDRLTGAGVVGLGFGTGLTHQSVPVELSDAAQAVGLPLIEVPRKTPFIAISKAVSAAVAADQYAAVRRINEAQHVLTRAAACPDGFAALVRRLSSLLDAWVLLLDANGNPEQAAPAAAAEKAAFLAPDLDRLLAAGTVASAGINAGTEEVFIQTLGGGARHFLAVWRRTRLDLADRQIANAAAALLTVALEQSRTLTTTDRRLRSGIFHLMAAGHAGSIRHTAADLCGALPEEPLTVYVLAGPVTARAAAVDLLEIETRRPDNPLFFAETEPHVVVLTGQSDSSASFLSLLPSRLNGLRIGIAEPVRYETLANGYRQAVLAAESIAAHPVVHFTELAGQGLMRLLPADQARGFAEALLAPVLHHDADGRADLLISLRAWLHHHGQWDPAAARLGVHRHTLRNRLRKIEQLTGRSLDAPGFRAELWFALYLLDETTRSEPETAALEA